MSGAYSTMEPGADSSDPMRGLASMSPNPANSNEVVAGGNGLVLANTSTSQIVRRVSDELPTIAADIRSTFRAP